MNMEELECLTSDLEQTMHKIIGNLDNISYGCKTIVLCWDPNYSYEDYIECNPGEPRQKEYYFYTDSKKKDISDNFGLIKGCFKEMFQRDPNLAYIAKTALTEIDNTTLP